MNTNYKEPGKNVLEKFGFLEIDLIKKSVLLAATHSYEAEFNSGTCIATIFFTDGMIKIDEKLITNKPGDYTRVRLNRICIENDEELEVILRQTFPTYHYRPKC